MSLFYNELEVRNKMIDVLKNSLISNNGYRSTQQPFFCKDKGNLFEIQINNQDLYKLNIKLSNNLKDRILDYIQSNKYLQDIPLKLNRNIILIYQIFAQPQKEIYLGEWTILSLEQALEIYKSYCNEGQKNVFDIGYRHIGMGHIEVISCDLKSHLLFYRPDGGSNGYDREDNRRDVIQNGADKHQKFYFSNWFYNIQIDKDI